MELKQLDMLCAVIAEGSYQRAGDHLNISHSAIHRQIRLLEGELSARILVRKGKRVELTETGRILEELARRVRQDTTSVLQEIRDRNELRAGRIRIGTGTSMLTFFLPPVLEQFRKKFPGITVQMMTGTAEEVVTEIERGRLDAGVVFSPLENPERRPLVDYQHLYREEFVVCTGKLYRPSARFISLEELAAFPFITYSRTSHVRRSIERMFTSAGLKPRIDMELENEEVIEKMLAIGMGMAILTRRRAVRDRLHHVRIRNYPLAYNVMLLSRKSEYQPRIVVEFSNLCKLFAKEV
jgi:DNA-binding transcriptional LysR family regulator